MFCEKGGGITFYIVEADTIFFNNKSVNIMVFIIKECALKLFHLVIERYVYLKPLKFTFMNLD